MKKVLLLLACLGASLSQLLAADSGWYLYIWSNTTNSGSDVGQFQTTGIDGMYVLEGVTTTESGLKFCIHNSAWTTCYGWSQGSEGTVSYTGTEVPLGSTTATNGYIGLAAGTYDVTFHLNTPFVQFDTPVPAVSRGTMKVSILGDSYSTYYGYLRPYINKAWYSTYTTQYYPDNDVTSVEQTWWYKFITQNSGYILERNNSYSGATMVNGCLQDMPVSTSFISRALDLGDPDIIFVFGGTNDWWNNNSFSLGEYKYSDWTDAEKAQFRPGFAYLLNLLQTTYPGKEIFFILNDLIDDTGNGAGTSTNVRTSIKTICAHYDIPIIELADIAKGSYHPTEAGMTAIASQVKEALRSQGIDSAISYTTYPDGHALATVNDYLRGGDISMLSYVESMGAKFYDANGVEKDALDIMQENGVNIVRLRLYNHPGNSVTYNSTTYKVPEGFLGEDDVLSLARRAKQHNMKIELTFHYSDFWTNGEYQFKPKGWEGYNMEQLKTAVYDYTKQFLQKMAAQGTTPEYVSLGNEIQGGLLFGKYDTPDAVNGKATNDNMANVAALLNQGSAAVREVCSQSKVVIHLTLSTGVTESTYQWFFDKMKDNSLDYDIIGTSYYPYWTEQKPTMLTSLANNMYTRYGKDILIMEVGYSWTQYLPSGRTGGNYEGQLHLNGSVYNEASKAGQKSFMQELQAVVKANDHILGYLYWDPVMIDQQVNSSWIQTTWALRKSGGNWYQDGNVVSNTTWFDYEGRALPVFEAIGKDAVSIPASVTIGGNTYTVKQQPPFELTVGETEYATFYDGVARTLPNGLTAYTVQGVVDSKLSTQESELSVIPADFGVLLQGNEGSYYLWPRYDDESTVSGNMLYGTTTEQTIATPVGSYYYYKLAVDDGKGLGWYWGRVDGGVFTNGAHKAYLAVPQSQANARSFIPLFDSETTAVEALNPEPLTVNQEVYDLQGRCVAQPTKGVYILNRKKVIIK